MSSPLMVPDCSPDAAACSRSTSRVRALARRDDQVVLEVPVGNDHQNRIGVEGMTLGPLLQHLSCSQVENQEAVLVVIAAFTDICESSQASGHGNSRVHRGKSSPESPSAGIPAAGQAGHTNGLAHRLRQGPGA
ncbi:hypothetical protein ACFL0I_03320, partial [Gemmatimonadota bacterium]